MAVATAAVVADRYPTLAAVVQLDVEGAKRRRVLAVLAAYVDEGHEPSLREIAERAGLDGWRKAEVLIRRLEADGLVRVQWMRYRRGRNRYELLIGGEPVPAPA